MEKPHLTTRFELRSAIASTVVAPLPCVVDAHILAFDLLQGTRSGATALLRTRGSGAERSWLPVIFMGKCSGY